MSKHKGSDSSLGTGLSNERIQSIFAADQTNVTRSSKSAAIYKVQRGNDVFYALKRSSNTQLYRVPTYLMSNLPSGAKTKAVNLIAQNGETSINDLKLQKKVQLQ